MHGITFKQKYKDWESEVGGGQGGISFCYNGRKVTENGDFTVISEVNSGGASHGRPTGVCLDASSSEGQDHRRTQPGVTWRLGLLGFYCTFS